MNNLQTHKIPWWIYLFAVLSVLSSLVGIYSGYIDASGFYSEFDAVNWEAKHIKHLSGMWASKNVALVLALLYGFFKKDFRWLAAIFLFKFICDTIDIFYVNIMFREGSAGSVVTNLINWIILALPGLVATVYLLNKSKTPK